MVLHARHQPCKAPAEVERKRERGERGTLVHPANIPLRDWTKPSTLSYHQFNY